MVPKFHFFRYRRASVPVSQRAAGRPRFYQITIKKIKKTCNLYGHTVQIILMIILSIRHRGLKRLIENNSPRGIRGDLINRVRNIITALILAEDMNDFITGAPPGWRVHQLSGDRKGTWSISASGNWRITFEEAEGYLDFLHLEDYH